MKWVIIIFAAILTIAIVTGYMGGAKQAAGNYGKVMRGG
jgi:hypothetical protein